jgi:hypothetical protein
MHGPPLTTLEIGALLCREISRLTVLGVAHQRAVANVAHRHGIAPEVTRSRTGSGPKDVYADNGKSGTAGRAQRSS